MSRLPSLDTAPLTIDDVLERFRAIDAQLAPTDGLRAFNQLYTKMTEEVARSVAGTTFEDEAFMRRLDVVFATRYFAAVRDAFAPRPASRAWQALFDHRGRRGVSTLRFAIAGMSAHINFDLALALVDTCRERGVPLVAGSPQYRDYERINTVLARTMPLVKVWYSTGLIGVLDTAMGDVDDVLALVSIVRAREAAWTHGETLWALPGPPALAARLVETLDRSVGLMGRALLAPQVPLQA